MECPFSPLHLNELLLRLVPISVSQSPFPSQSEKVQHLHTLRHVLVWICNVLFSVSVFLGCVQFTSSLQLRAGNLFFMTSEVLKQSFSQCKVACQVHLEYILIPLIELPFYSHNQEALAMAS